MLGLVSSLVLRCDDCVTYHVVRCHEEGVTREEFLEIFSVGLVVGGSIVIPHLRRAMESPGGARRERHRSGRRAPGTGSSTPAMIRPRSDRLERPRPLAQQQDRGRHGRPAA